MNIRPIRTEADYDEALEEIARYFEDEPRPGTPAADRFDLLATLIDAYENMHWPIDPPHPIAAIEHHMLTHNYTQADLAKVIGSRSRASEILRRRRHLTLDMVWRLNRRWGIPAESLIRPYRLSQVSGRGRRDG
jgi:HTH-type transcriptional regulator/antitoxin HigA